MITAQPVNGRENYQTAGQVYFGAFLVEAGQDSTGVDNHGDYFNMSAS
jgi:hypothetical protein